MRILLVAFCCVLASAPSAMGQAVLPEGLTSSEWTGIRGTYEAGRHAAHCVDDGFRARNPGQQWTTRFDGRGFLTEPDTGGWAWGLELLRFGFVGSEQTVTSPPRVRAEGGHVSYVWDATLTEWYVNDTRGLEHGYTVHQRPTGRATVDGMTGPLTFTLSVRGGLSPTVATNGRDVRFIDGDGAATLTYSGLTVLDADDCALAAGFEVVSEGLRLTIDERDARYPLTIDPVVQRAYLKASNTDVDDRFGSSVAMSGDTLVIGAPWEDSNATGVNGDQSDNSAPYAGAVYVFVRAGTTWSQQAYLKPSTMTSGDQFGSSVSISGDTLVVGALGENSAATGVNGDQSDISEPDSGAAYVFVRNGTTWSQQAYLKASNTDGTIGLWWPGDEFGKSISISGDTVVVGAWGEASGADGVDGDQSDNDSYFAGAAYVFVRNGTTWSQQAYLKASNSSGGETITNTGDEFGISVSISGDTLVVGADSENSAATGVNGDQFLHGGSSSGAAYVFVRNGTTWSQQAYLKASNTGVGDAFGQSVSLSGDSLVIGAWSEDSNAIGVNGDQSDNLATHAGAAYVFTRSGTTWSQQAYLKASNTDGIPLMMLGDEFGSSVSISGDTIAVGAMEEDSNATGVDGDQGDNSANASGAVYVFQRSGTTWSQLAYLKASNTEADDELGLAVAVSGDTVVATTQAEASNATGVGGDQGDNTATGSGAAYVFDLAFEAWSDLGGGTVGSAGQPTLVGSDSLVGGTLASVTLTNAPPSATMLVWISFAPVPFAALGGTVHAFPFANQLLFTATGAGSFTGATTWPTGVPAGANIWFQFLVQDGSVPEGITLSNGLLATTP